MLRATHFGPTVLVCLLSFVMADLLQSFGRALEVTFAIFLGQCFVGWSNDLIDYPRDVAAQRFEKPLVRGDIKVATLKVLVPMALAVALVTSWFGPLGFAGTSVHALALASASAYNLGMKGSRLSALPYVVSFGLLPIAIYDSVGRTPPAWLIVAVALFATAFHFVNVIKDMEGDRALKIYGLPQRLGSKASLCVAVALCLLASAVVVFAR